MKKRVFIYIRVSSREQAEEGYSIGEQEERLKKYCEAMDWQLVKIYIDPGFSGADMGRPALQDMIRDIKKDKADIVLVDKLDRLSRSQFDTLYLIKKVFTIHGCAFVSRAEAFDTSTPFGRAMVGILAVFAELERERIRERTMDGKEGRAKEGKYHGGGYPAIGYDYSKDDGLLHVNEYEAMQVREVFEMFNNEVPIARIAKIFNGKGYRTKYGGWYDNTIRKIVENPVYIGKIKHQDKLFDGLHESIIDEEVFEKAKQVLKERSIKFAHFKQGRRYTSPLGALLWCGNCGAKYHHRRNGTNKDGTKRSYYMCYSRAKSDRAMVKDPNCKNKIYRDRDLERIVFGEIMKLKEDKSYINDIKKTVDSNDKAAQIEKRIKQIESQVSRYMDMYSVEGIDFDMVKGKIVTLQTEKNQLTEELENIRDTSPKMSNHEITTLVEDFERIRESGNAEKLETAVRKIIDHIELEGEDIRIHWNF